MKATSANLPRHKANRSVLIKIKTPLGGFSYKAPDSQQSITETPGRIIRLANNSLNHRAIHSQSPGYSFSKISRFESDIFERFKCDN